jgi:hypothetical protein
MHGLHIVEPPPCPIHLWGLLKDVAASAALSFHTVSLVREDGFQLFIPFLMVSIIQT